MPRRALILRKKCMPKTLNKPTAEEAEQFDDYVRHWQEVLNLMDWRMERGTKPEKDAMASVECDAPARLAVYRIGHFGATKITPESLSLTALHECLHVFLHPLIEAAQDRTTTPEQLEMQEHRVINVLERLLGETYARAEGQ